MTDGVLWRWKHKHREDDWFYGTEKPVFAPRDEPNMVVEQVAGQPRSYVSGEEMKERLDATATARTVILSAIAETGGKTGLRAGPAVDALIAAILREIADPSTKWAFQALLR